MKISDLVTFNAYQPFACLLSLALETRLLIYNYYLTNLTQFVYLEVREGHGLLNASHRNLLLVCKQIYSEAVAECYHSVHYGIINDKLIPQSVSEWVDRTQLKTNFFRFATRLALVSLPPPLVIRKFENLKSITLLAGYNASQTYGLRTFCATAVFDAEEFFSFRRLSETLDTRFGPVSQTTRTALIDHCRLFPDIAFRVEFVTGWPENPQHRSRQRQILRLSYRRHHGERRDVSPRTLEILRRSRLPTHFDPQDASWHKAFVFDVRTSTFYGFNVNLKSSTLVKMVSAREECWIDEEDPLVPPI